MSSPMVEPLVPPPKDEFPTFADGDVFIYSQSGSMWKLHRRTLCSASEHFKRILHLEQQPGSRPSKKIWHVFMENLDRAQNVDPNGMHYKNFVVGDKKGKGIHAMGSWNGVGQEAKFNTIYDNLFRCMYNITPNFNTPVSQDVDAPIKEALNLLTAASYAKAYPAVRLVIESHLLQFHQLLWYQVEKNPETWASVGCKLQSAMIFREAMIHLAGRYHLRGVEGIRKNKLEAVEFGQDIWELVIQKARELKDYKLQTERRLFEFVPPRMLHPAHEEVGGMVTAGRQVYAGDIYWWMCLHLIRQYFSIAVLQNRHHRAADGGIAFYRTIAAPHSYLLKNSLDAFHEMFCMTAKSRVVFIHGLGELKKDFVSVVEGLLVDHCQAQRAADANPRIYLTCTVVLDEEMPWVDKDQQLPRLPAVRITDEDEDEVGDLVDVDDDARANALLSSSPNSLFIKDRRPIPAPAITDPIGSAAFTACGMQPQPQTQAGPSNNNTTSSQPVSRRRHSEITPSSDDEETPISGSTSQPPPPKKPKVSLPPPRRPTFPADNRMSATDAMVLDGAIRTGLVSEMELQRINQRAEIAAAEGIPNMGGLIANPTTKPRGGLNSLFAKAISGGFGNEVRAEKEVEEDEVDESASRVEGGESTPRSGQTGDDTAQAASTTPASSTAVSQGSGPVVPQTATIPTLAAATVNSRVEGTPTAVSRPQNFPVALSQAAIINTLPAQAATGRAGTPNDPSQASRPQRAYSVVVESQQPRPESRVLPSQVQKPPTRESPRPRPLAGPPDENDGVFATTSNQGSRAQEDRPVTRYSYSQPSQNALSSQQPYPGNSGVNNRMSSSTNQPRDILPGRPVAQMFPSQPQPQSQSQSRFESHGPVDRPTSGNQAIAEPRSESRLPSAQTGRMSSSAPGQIPVQLQGEFRSPYFSASGAPISTSSYRYGLPRLPQPGAPASTRPMPAIGDYPPRGYVVSGNATVTGNSATRGGVSSARVPTTASALGRGRGQIGRSGTPSPARAPARGNPGNVSGSESSASRGSNAAPKN